MLTSWSPDSNTYPLNFDATVIVAGYECYGWVYEAPICLQQNCKVIDFLAVTNVYDDWFAYGEAAAFGILAYGPSSGIWSLYMDPVSETAIYSISVSR